MHLHSDVLNRKKVLFVINPISGGISKTHVPIDIDKTLDKTLYDVDIFWWQNVSELDTKLSNFVSQLGWLVVAVGGDGTVNVVAKTLRHSEVLLAILPMGSGNGLARQLGYRRTPKDFCQALNRPQQHSISALDIGLFNNVCFVNIAGIGFDGMVSQSFAGSSKRGITSYIKSVLQAFRQSGNQMFDLTIDDKEYSIEAFMVDIANGSQWGNDFFIAPGASLTDGLLDVMLVRKPNWYQVPGFVYALMRAKKHTLVTHLRGRKIAIKTSKESPAHVDGEPAGMMDHAEIVVKTSALNMLMMP